MHELAAVGHATALDDLVVEIEVEVPVLDQQQEQVCDVATVQLARVHRHRARNIAGAIDHHPAHVQDLARLEALGVAARLGGQVDDHRAGTHSTDHLLGHEDRGYPAGTAAV